MPTTNFWGQLLQAINFSWLETNTDVFIELSISPVGSGWLDTAPHRLHLTAISGSLFPFALILFFLFEVYPIPKRFQNMLGWMICDYFIVRQIVVCLPGGFIVNVRAVYPNWWFFGFAHDFFSVG